VLEASYLEDVSITEGIGVEMSIAEGTEEAEPRKAVIL
jgi:hypothetical protein